MAKFTSEKDDQHYQYAMQLASASVLPMALKAAVELGVLEIIERAGPGAMVPPSHIASQIPAQNNPHAPLVLDRILYLLASYSILTCSLTSENQDGKVQRLYGLAPVATYFLRNHHAGSVAPFLVMIQDKAMMDMWGYLKEAVLEGGRPYHKAHGMNAQEFLSKHPEIRGKLMESSKAFNPLLMEQLLEKYDGFQGLTSLVDVGGGDGSVLKMIISKHPHIKGINYDLAQVIEKSPAYPGIEHVAGDMFESVPKGDAIFIKWVVHMWDDEAFLKLLRNCYEALPANGKVIVVEMVVPEAPDTSVSTKSLLQFYLFMSSMTPRRQERTEREFGSLAKQAGFSDIRIACSAYNFSIVEFNKSM